MQPQVSSSCKMEPFGTVVDEYDSGRPAYPDALYDELEPLAGMTVLEGGAGTGIATVSLLRRGAHVVPFDIGINMLLRAMKKMPGVPGVLADGVAMPFRDEYADLLCFGSHGIGWMRSGERAKRPACFVPEAVGPLGGRMLEQTASHGSCRTGKPSKRRQSRDDRSATLIGAPICGGLPCSMSRNDGRCIGFARRPSSMAYRRQEQDLHRLVAGAGSDGAACDDSAEDHQVVSRRTNARSVRDLALGSDETMRPPSPAS